MFQAEVKFSFSFSCSVFVVKAQYICCNSSAVLSSTILLLLLLFFKFNIYKFGGIGQLPCYCLFFETKVAYFGKSAQYLK